MKTDRIISVVTALAFLAFARVAFTADADNAADLYRQALQATPVSPEDLETYKADHPSPEAVKAVLAKGEKALELLHQAAGVSSTDWKIDTDKPDCLAFLTPARWLSELSHLQVDSDIAAGKGKEAADAIADRLVMGRRLQKIRMAIPLLLGQGFENSALAQAAVNLPDLSDESIAIIAQAWGRARPQAGVDDVIEAEHLDAGSKQAETLRTATSRMEVLRAMFTAALKAPKGGADQFADTKDPMDGKPFEYKATKHGYQLDSEMQYKGKPVVLTVGKADERE